MSLWICKSCRAAYAVGAPRCPECGSKKWAEQGSKADPTLVDVDEVDEELELEVDEVDETVDEEG